jgi:class 3 adenylate cyclase
VAKSWNREAALKCIESSLENLNNITITQYVKRRSLSNIKTNEGCTLDGVHLYIDILNMEELLGTTAFEGETCHKRILQFLSLHYRAVDKILSSCNAIRVDYHNQRLHAVIAQPYNTEENAEAKRIHKAVAIAKTILDTTHQLDQEEDEDSKILPKAKIRVGIDSGIVLTVNNGRNGHREPLFLGDPANHAAKLASGGNLSGIFMSNKARDAIGLNLVTNEKNFALTADDVVKSSSQIELPITVDEIVKYWRGDINSHPIGKFKFSVQTPPLKNMDIHNLTPSTSKRQEAVSIYADIDGFTNYVTEHINSNPEAVVKVLHVLRSELERVLTNDFGGRRIRFIGDCVHGILNEGTVHSTEPSETITNAVICASALRSSFDLAIEILNNNGVETGNLGLQIGLEYGQIAVSRLGKQGDKIRCCISRAVIESEKVQMLCNGNQTALGEQAFNKAPEDIKKLFNRYRKANNLDYNEVIESLADSKNASASSLKEAAYDSSSTLIQNASNQVVRPYSK